MLKWYEVYIKTIWKARSSFIIIKNQCRTIMRGRKECVVTILNCFHSNWRQTFWNKYISLYLFFKFNWNEQKYIYIITNHPHLSAISGIVISSCCRFRIVRVERRHSFFKKRMNSLFSDNFGNLSKSFLSFSKKQKKRKKNMIEEAAKVINFLLIERSRRYLFHW